MQFLIVIGIISAIVIFMFYFNKPKKQISRTIDFHGVILYAADFLAQNPKELTVHLDQILYSELLDFLKMNRSKITNFEQLDSSSITFIISINDSKYKVYANKFIFDQLIIAAKALKE